MENFITCLTNFLLKDIWHLAIEHFFWVSEILHALVHSYSLKEHVTFTKHFLLSIKFQKSSLQFITKYHIAIFNILQEGTCPPRSTVYKINNTKTYSWQKICIREVTDCYYVRYGTCTIYLCMANKLNV